MKRRLKLDVTYEVRETNGTFVTVHGKNNALLYAYNLIGTSNRVSEDDLRRHWGIKITKLSRANAIARGLA